jgi:hypothetical protein
LVLILGGTRRVSGWRLHAIYRTSENSLLLWKRRGTVAEAKYFAAACKSATYLTS